MEEQKRFDQEIYDFVDQKLGPERAPGNDNLRRAIERMLRPLREGLPQILQNRIGLPIPAGIRKTIQQMISLHKGPPDVSRVLAKAKGSSSESQPGSS